MEKPNTQALTADQQRDVVDGLLLVVKQVKELGVSAAVGASGAAWQKRRR